MATIKTLSNTELKTLWLKGGVYNQEGDLLSFDDMVRLHKTGNTVYINDGDNVVAIHAPMPKWMVGGLFCLFPVGIYLLDNALRIAGY